LSCAQNIFEENIGIFCISNRRIAFKKTIDEVDYNYLK